MTYFTPTLGIKDTSQNVRQFVKDNKNAFWDVFKPLLPWILLFHLGDIVLGYFFFEPDPKTGGVQETGVGRIFTAYFYACLIISWHRVVIHGPERYTPVNPFKPRKSELVFMGMVIALSVAMILGILPFAALVFIDSAYIFSMLIAFIGLFYIILRFCLYFPAKATGNDLTLRQAFRMSKGLFLKIVGACFLAPLKLIFGMFAFTIGIISIMLILVSITEIYREEVMLVITLIHVFFVDIYFDPLLTIFGVTVVSNYYQYVLQYKPYSAT